MTSEQIKSAVAEGVKQGVEAGIRESRAVSPSFTQGHKESLERISEFFTGPAITEHAADHRWAKKWRVVQERVTGDIMRVFVLIVILIVLVALFKWNLIPGLITVPK